MDQFYNSFFHSNVSDEDINAVQDKARCGDTNIAVEVQNRNQQMQKSNWPVGVARIAVGEFVSRNWGDQGADSGN
jgi:hypothetical protein